MHVPDTLAPFGMHIRIEHLDHANLPIAKSVDLELQPTPSVPLTYSCVAVDIDASQRLQGAY
jgi:hypothetical protein